jgi:hypothetical protein
VGKSTEDGVDDPTQAILAGPAQGLGPGQEGFEDGPLGVGQVARIGLRSHPITTSESHLGTDNHLFPRPEPTVVGLTGAAEFRRYVFPPATVVSTNQISRITVRCLTRGFPPCWPTDGSGGR